MEEMLITQAVLESSSCAFAEEIWVNVKNGKEILKFTGMSIPNLDNPRGNRDGRLGNYHGVPVFVDDSITERFKLIFDQKEKIKLSFNEEILEGLINDAKKLNEKLSGYPSASDYKMLINNLKTTMELIQQLENKKDKSDVEITFAQVVDTINKTLIEYTDGMQKSIISTLVGTRDLSDIVAIHEMMSKTQLTVEDIRKALRDKLTTK